MEREEFVLLRKKLKKTQAQMAQLLGVSLKAIHSYEQGWRIIPAHAERQLYFLVSRMFSKNRMKKLAGRLRDVLKIGKGDALHGSSVLENSAGLSMEPFVKGMRIKTGRIK